MQERCGLTIDMPMIGRDIPAMLIGTTVITVFLLPTHGLTGQALLAAIGSSRPPAVGEAGEPAPETEEPAAVDESALGTLFHPKGPGLGNWRLGIGGGMDILPRRLVESELRQIVRVGGTVRFGLPYHLSAQIDLNTAIITHELCAGGAWSLDTGPVSWALRYRLGFWLGYLGVTGFDTTGLGLTSYPGVGVGTRIGDHRLTLNVEAIIPHWRATRFGDASVSNWESLWGGLFGSLTVESPVGGGLIYYGFAVARADLDYQLWLAFADNPFTLFYSRIFAGYVF